MISVTETASHLFVRQIKERHIFAPMKHFDELSNLSQKLAVASKEKSLRSEPEKETEDYLVRPFIDFIGYNVADADHVKWQYNTAPDGAEPKPVDFALFRELRGEPRPFVLIEVKSFGKRLSKKDVDQLSGYVSRTTARFGILTNGDQCKWYKKLPNELMDDRPFLKHSLIEPSEKEMEWISAISDRTTDRDILERLAWRLSLEIRIREWLTSTFDTPGNPTAINKIVGLGVPKKELDIVLAAASIVWRDLQTSWVSKPVDPKPTGYVEVFDRSDDRIELGEDVPKLARAWRIGKGNWQVEDNAVKATQSVLRSLLECDARRDRRDQLAGVAEIVSWNSARGKAYKQIPGFTELCFDAYIPNDKKVQLLQNVSNEIEFRPPPGHPLSEQPTIEVWMPAGTSYTKGR